MIAACRQTSYEFIIGIIIRVHSDSNMKGESLTVLLFRLYERKENDFSGAS